MKTHCFFLSALVVVWTVPTSSVLAAPDGLSCKGRTTTRKSPRKRRPRRANVAQLKALNTPDAKGLTALMRACSYPDANFDEAKKLLARGADPNVQNASGDTALIFVTASMPTGVEEMPNFVHLLLRFGAKPNVQNASGDTALTIACSEHYVEGQSEAWGQAMAANDAMPEAYAKIVLDLRRHGARLDLKNKNGQTALDLALAARMGSSLTHKPDVVAALKAPLK